MNTQRIQFTCGRHFVIVLISWLLFLALGNTNASAQVSWQQTKGPEGGSITALAINANGEVFAGTFGGGVFRSSNNGDSWTVVMADSYVWALSIANGFIFAGTNAGKMLLSTGNGDNWATIKIGMTNKDVLALAINSSGHIFAGTNGGGVFRSTDFGANWTAVNAGLTNNNVHALAINASGHIFAGTEGGGVFRYTDNDASWTAVNNGLKNLNVMALTINSRGEIWAGTNGGGVFRSTDNGANWTEVNAGLKNNTVHALAINASGHIFAGTEGGGVFRNTYTNKDPSWSGVYNNLTNGYVRSLAINSSGHIFAGTNGGGVFRSTNNGDSWTAVNAGLTNSFVRALAINASGHIFAGTYNGVFRSTNNGDSWTAVNTGLNSHIVLALAIDASNRIFAGTHVGGVSRSTDNGNSWEAVNINNSFTNWDVWSLTINASGHIWVGTGHGVFRSTNNGDSWTVVNGLQDTSVNALAINSNGDIFAGTSVGVFLSTNNGNSWTAANNGLTNKVVNALATNTSGHIFAGTPSGVFRFTNNGSRWTAAGLTNNSVYAFAINKADGKIFAGTDGGGVFRSTNNGDNWVSDNDGLTNTRAFGLAINASEAIFVGTYGKGVFRGVDYPYPFTLSLEKTYNFSTYNKASDYKVGDYRIVGLPGASNKSLKEFLNGDQGKDWQVYWDNGSLSTDPKAFLKEFDGSDTFRFKVGRAFWLINRDTLTIKTSADAVQLNSNQEAEILLHSGWNLITNPFNRPVDWSKVQEANGNFSDPIHEFRAIGSFRTSPTFEPYVGYYFFNTGSLPILKVPLSAVSSTTTPAQASKRAVWEVKIGLASKDILDQSTSFGIATEARAGLDHFEYRKPRAVGAIPQVAFKRPEWDENYGIFATDFRPQFEEAETWEFEVLSPQRQPMTITFSDIASVPAQYEVFLIDEARARYVNLREDSLYNFTPSVNISKFTVQVGKAEALKEKLETIIPRKFALEQNFPNPFLSAAKSPAQSGGNPTTAIPVTVPVTSEVKLKIYNLLGKEVKTLHSGSLEPGRHFFNWDGRDETGNVLTTGVYFYRLTTNARVTLVGKMILIR